MLDYLHALVAQAFQFYAGVVTALVALGESFTGKKFLWTRRWWLGLAVVLFLWANFSAWSEENQKRRHAELAEGVAQRALADDAPKLVGLQTAVATLTNSASNDHFGFIGVRISNRGKSPSTATDFQSYILRHGLVIHGRLEHPSQNPTVKTGRINGQSFTIIYSQSNALMNIVSEIPISAGESRDGLLLFRFEHKSVGKDLRPEEIHVTFRDVQDNLIDTPPMKGPSTFPEGPFFQPHAK
jgi:hypothetical protein